MAALPSELLIATRYLSLDDKNLLKRAWQLCKSSHEGKLRLSGEKYCLHPLATAVYLANLNLDVQTLCAALLHDVPEDTHITINQIKSKFGTTIAHLISGVTKLSQVRLRRSWFGIKVLKSSELQEFDRQTETLRKMILAMAKDIRVVLIKLADRRHNMMTLEHVQPTSQIRIAKETLEIYAPLANRLGMGELKGELEDLAFPYVQPQAHKKLYKEVKKAYEIRARESEIARRQIIKILAIKGVIVKSHARAKHLYSLWQKLQKPKYNNNIELVYDIVAVRIITADIEECYRVLGILHSKWKPLPGRVKDYIATPKPNGYRSLHTTLFGPKGKIIEIQIRTEDMHEQAELGIAAHWFRSLNKNSQAYKSDKASFTPLNQLKWVKELAKFQKAIKDPKELHASLRTDFFSDRIFVFTPKGDVRDLPVGSTPIDFAYSIHSEIGDRMVGVKVNNKIVSIKHKLQNGDVVNVIVGNNSKGPKSGWLDFVVSSNAKYHIKKYIRRRNIIPNLINITRRKIKYK